MLSLFILHALRHLHVQAWHRPLLQVMTHPGPLAPEAAAGSPVTQTSPGTTALNSCCHSW